MKIGQYLELQYALLLQLFAGRASDMSRDGTASENFLTEYVSRGTVGETWYDTRWMGVRTLKCPLDLWVYQEIVFETKPSVIIETGTFEGGSALFLATLCDTIGQGEVISIDVESKPHRPIHPRIHYVSGSSVDPVLTDDIRARLLGKSVMVILDSDHFKSHVSQELQLFAPIVSKGHYLIVEDTCLNGHPVAPECGPGPMEAVEDFLQRNDDFEADRSREKFLMTFNPRGYLKRTKEAK